MIPKWWTPTVRKIEGKVEVGQTYKIIWSEQKFSNQSLYGVFVNVFPSRLIEMTWRWDTVMINFDSLISLNFSYKNNQTVFEFRHKNIRIPKEIISHHEAWQEILNIFSEYASLKD